MKTPVRRDASDVAASAIEAAMEKARAVKAREKLWKQLLPTLRRLQREQVPYVELAEIATRAGYPVSGSTVWRRLRRSE